MGAVFKREVRGDYDAKSPAFRQHRLSQTLATFPVLLVSILPRRSCVSKVHRMFDGDGMENDRRKMRKAGSLGVAHKEMLKTAAGRIAAEWVTRRQAN